MKKILFVLFTTLFLSINANAQLVSEAKPDGPSVTWPAAGLAAKLSGKFATVIGCEHVTEGVLMPQLRMEYAAIGQEYMVESVTLTIRKHKNGRSGLVGDIPAKDELETHTVKFHPVEKEMKHFKASLDIVELGWDDIEIKFVEESAKIILKKNYKPDPLLK